MTYGMIAVAGATLVGAAVSSNASKSAAAGQADAARNAAGMTQAQFNTTNAQQAPYRNAGYAGLNKLQYLLGLGNPNQTTGGQIDFQGLANDPAMKQFFAASGWTPNTWGPAAQDDLQQRYGGDVGQWAKANSGVLSQYGIKIDPQQYIVEGKSNALICFVAHNHIHTYIQH